MELGLGIHGEAGAEKGPLSSVNDIVAKAPSYVLWTLCRASNPDAVKLGAELPHLSDKFKHNMSLKGGLAVYRSHYSE